MSDKLIKVLDDKQNAILLALRDHASKLLDFTPRFKYLTLHGIEHINNMFKLTDMLLNFGLSLSEQELFLLGCSICVHDLGMVIPINKLEESSIFNGKPQPAEPANIEMQIRSNHHELIKEYVDEHYDFLLSSGLSTTQCSYVQDISRNHRKTDLDTSVGIPRYIGALLRVIDELDIYSSRAPIAVLFDHYQEMDSTSCWHWLKHNICEDWNVDHNVKLISSDPPIILFTICVHPSKEESIPYWLTQCLRPISRVFSDERAASIIADKWGIQLRVDRSHDMSSVLSLGPKWPDIESEALSGGRKVVLVIDDEVRKMEDLFWPLMEDYHVIFSSNAKDALDKLAARNVDLVIVDLQMGSGFIWTSTETQNYKMTGFALCKEVIKLHHNAKIGILTGSRYDTNQVADLDNIVFFYRKPIDPDVFEKGVRSVLES